MTHLQPLNYILIHVYENIMHNKKDQMLSNFLPLPLSLIVFSSENCHIFLGSKSFFFFVVCQVFFCVGYLYSMSVPIDNCVSIHDFIHLHNYINCLYYCKRTNLIFKISEYYFFRYYHNLFIQ